MTNIHETAYPILPAEPSACRTESVVYTDHGRDALSCADSPGRKLTAVLIMVQLKLLQRLDISHAVGCAHIIIAISAPHLRVLHNPRKGSIQIQAADAASRWGPIPSSLK